MTQSLTMRLVGRAEIRKMLGVSHTRVVFLASQPDFPPPLDELSVGKIWSLDDVLAWADKRGRTLNLEALTTDVQAGDDSTP